MDFTRNTSPAVTVACAGAIGLGAGAALGIALGNLPVWLSLAGGIGAAIGGGLLIEQKLNRLIFMVLLIAISSMLAVTVTYADSGRVIHVKLTLEEGAQFSQDWPVYVYASTPGSKLPLSSTRVPLSELPTTVELTEAMYVLPGMTMKGHSNLVVTAKVSSSPDVHKKGPEDSYSLSPELVFSGPERQAVELIVKGP